MALRLAKVIDTTPNLWLGLQKEYDLWHAEHDTNAWQNAVKLAVPVNLASV
jgi:plasmid maintenance system antidote protein VapI